MRVRYPGLSRCFILVLWLCLQGCAGRPAQRDATGLEVDMWYRKEAEDTLLALSYRNVLFSFSTTPAIESALPGMIWECQDSAILWLNRTGRFSGKRKQEARGKPQGNTLLVEAHIPEMRMVQADERKWWGMMTGVSWMNMDVKLIDAASGDVLRTKKLSTAANPYASAYTSWQTDRSIDDDMGKILADYIMTVVPSAQGNQTETAPGQ